MVRSRPNTGPRNGGRSRRSPLSERQPPHRPGAAATGERPRERRKAKPQRAAKSAPRPAPGGQKHRTGEREGTRERRGRGEGTPARRGGEGGAAHGRTRRRRRADRAKRKPTAPEEPFFRFHQIPEGFSPRRPTSRQRPRRVRRNVRRSGGVSHRRTSVLPPVRFPRVPLQVSNRH